MRRFIDASYPCLYVTTFEIDRAMQHYKEQIREINKENEALPKAEQDTPYEAYKWDCVDGLSNLLEPDKVVEFAPTEGDGRGSRPVPSNRPDYAIRFINERSKNTVLFLPNFHFFTRPESGGITVMQMIYNGYVEWKHRGKSIVVLSTGYQMPQEIDRLFQLIDFPLPDDQFIRKIMERIVPTSLLNPNYDPSSDDDEKKTQYYIEFREDALRAAKGMTAIEIENAFSLSLIEKQEFDPIIISQIKQQQIKKSATLQVSQATHKFDDVIGLIHLKPYLLRVVNHVLAQGSMIVGVNGCGKTYIAEAVANELGLPAVIVNFENIMAAGGGIVGQAQNQAIQAFKILDAMSPCIAIFDELAKGLAGVESSGRTDSGTKAGVGSIFMKWIEKKTPGIYPIATCNDIDSLPSAYKRAGRWDTIIGVDLPVTDEIYDNLLYYGQKYLTDEAYESMIETLDADNHSYVDDLYGYSHAELMTIVKQMAMLECSIDDARKFVKKIWEVDKDRIDAIRSWIHANATMASDSYFRTPKA